MLKNSKVVLFLSPENVGQAGNFWTLLRTCRTVVTKFQDKLLENLWDVRESRKDFFLLDYWCSHASYSNADVQYVNRMYVTTI